MKPQWGLYILFFAIAAGVIFLLNRPQGKENSSTATQPSKSPTHGAQSGSAKKVMLLQLLDSKSASGKWSVSVGEDGRSLFATGGVIKHPLKDTGADQEVADTFFKSVGLDKSKAVRSAHQISDTPYTSLKSFEQRIEGFRVYGGALKFSQRLSDGGIFAISLDLHTVEQVPLEVLMDFETVRASLLKEASEQLNLSLIEEKPVVIPMGEGRGELAWHILQTREKSVARESLLVSARTGRVLLSKSLLVR